MQQNIVTACEHFSAGQSEALLALIAKDIAWHIVGDRTIEGALEVRSICEEAAKLGTPNFKNGRVIRSKHHLVIEGRDLDADIHYCDIYTIEKQQVTEITSYSLSGTETD